MFINVLLVFFIGSLTCYADHQQQHADKILNLPGQHFKTNFYHYSGYVTVEEVPASRNIFYWLIESPNQPTLKPLILWLNGGPGCSSIGYGEAVELGPFHIQPDGKTLYLNPYAWNQAANIIFLDSPAGVGYSYSTSMDDTLNIGDKRTAENSLTSSINLKGYMVGNPAMDYVHEQVGFYQYMWSIGLVSDQTYYNLNKTCVGKGNYLVLTNTCFDLLSGAIQEMGTIDLYNIFADKCPEINANANRILKRLLSDGNDPCIDRHTAKYFNLPAVQKALHVHPQFEHPWEACRHAIADNWKDTAASVLDIYHELIDAGLRIWVISGNTDVVIWVTATRFTLKAMNLRTVSPWRSWMIEGKVGGWVQEYNGLTFVVVRGAGHEIPKNKPKEALTVFKSFLAGKAP